MKIIWSLALLLIGFVSFGQTSYFDKGTGSGQSLKLGAKAMDWLSENNVDAIWNYCSPRAKIDTAEIEGIGTLVSEEYQANEGREPVIDLKNDIPNAVYERTFYQVNEDGSILYLLQIKMAIVEENGNLVISTIKSLKGASVRKYDKLIKANPEEKEEIEPKTKQVPKSRKTDEEEGD